MSHTTPPPTDPPLTPTPDPHADPQPNAKPDPALAAAHQELATLKTSLATSERRRTLDRALLEAGAIDLDAAALIAAAHPDAATTDPAKLVATLKRTKPFLFHPMRTTATAAPITPDPAPLDSAAAQARTTGDRRSLLHYLRLRRQTPS